MKKLFEPITTDEIEFLEQSNFIEGVRDGLDDAVLAWKYIKTKNKLDIFTILKTHRILMKHRKLQLDEVGAFRKVAVYIGNREGALWYAVPELISQWVVNANDILANGKNENETYLDNIIREHHVRYEGIHPFVDGNGRTGRIFMNWLRYKMGIPVLVIREEERFNYYKWFEKNG